MSLICILPEFVGWLKSGMLSQGICSMDPTREGTQDHDIFISLTGTLYVINKSGTVVGLERCLKRIFCVFCPVQKNCPPCVNLWEVTSRYISTLTRSKGLNKMSDLLKNVFGISLRRRPLLSCVFRCFLVLLIIRRRRCAMRQCA